MANMEEVLARCTNVLPGHGRSDLIKGAFQRLADALQGDETLDHYGSGPYIAAFEAEVAAMFAKEAALFFPSGTMAQQIALRIWCDRRKNPTVAMHPTAHPEWAEHQAYRYLHRLERLQFGAPEFVGSRLLTVKDFEALAQEPGAVLLELPHRPLAGNCLPGKTYWPPAPGPTSAEFRCTWTARASGSAALFTGTTTIAPSRTSLTASMFRSTRTWAAWPARC